MVTSGYLICIRNLILNKMNSELIQFQNRLFKAGSGVGQYRGELWWLGVPGYLIQGNQWASSSSNSGM